MKKAFLLLCAVFALLLCSCDRTPGAVETESGKAAQSTEASAAADAAGSDTVESTNAVNPEPYVLKVAPEDRNQAFFGDFVETPEGCYYGWEKLIYFCPRGGDAFRPLCGKPNCKHEDANCNAWYHGLSLGYYDGSLYAVDTIARPHKIEVVKMNLDGTDHRVVTEVDVSEVENLPYTCTFHHGKLFVQSQSALRSEMVEEEDHLIAVDLSDYSQTELAQEFLKTSKLPIFFGFYKDLLFGYGSGDKVHGMLKEYQKLIEVDAVTGEARIFAPKRVRSIYVTDSTLYSFEPDLTAMGYEKGDVEPGFVEYDLETGAVKECGMPPLEGATWAVFDEDYICAGTNQTNQTVFFLSRDYNLLGQIELKNGQNFIAMTSDRIYFSDVRPDSPIAFYIDKSKISTGELEMIPIKTVK